MDSVIKVEQNPVRQAVSTLKTSTQSFESAFAEDIEGENQLALLNELRQLNHTYSELLQSYQTMLLKHIQITVSSVDTLVETDETIANQLLLFK